MKNEKEEIKEGKKYEHTFEVSVQMQDVQRKYYLYYLFDLKKHFLTSKEPKESFGFAMNKEYYRALKAIFPDIIEQFEINFKEEVHHKTNDWMQINNLSSCNSWHKREYREEQMFLKLVEIAKKENKNVLELFEN